MLAAHEVCILGLRLSLFLFLLGAIATTSAGNLREQSTFLAEAIQSKTVRDVLFDDSGRIWIGTQTGLQILRGQQGSRLNSPSSVSDVPWTSDIVAIQQDRKKNTLVLTANSGLLGFPPPGRHEKYRRVHNFRNATSMLLDSRDSIWIASLAGLTRLTINSEFLSTSNTQLWPTRAAIQSNLVELPDARVCGAFPNEIKCYSDSKNTESPPVSISTRDVGEVSSLAILSSSQMIAGTKDGVLIQISVMDFSVEHTTDICRRTQCRITVMQPFDQGILIGTDQGLYVLDSNSLVRTIMPNSLITRITPREGQFWISTFSGLKLVTESSFYGISSRNSVIADEVLGFAELRDGTVLVGTYNGAFLYRRQLDPQVIELTTDSLSGEEKLKVMAVASNKDQAVLSVRGRGLATYRHGDNSLSIMPESIGLSSPISVLAYLDGIGFIAGAASGSVHLLEIEAGIIGEPIEIDTLNFESPVTSITATDNGVILITSEYRFGFICLGGDSIVCGKTQTPLNLTGTRILSSHITESGRVLLGTQNRGIFVSDKPIASGKLLEFQRLQSASFPSASVYSIVADASGFLWSSTSSGLLQFTSSLQMLRRFTKLDGLQSDDFNFGAFLVHSEGSLYFGGSKGFNHFEPGDIDSYTKNTSVYLDHTEIDSEVIDIATFGGSTSSITLSPDDKYLKIGFYTDRYIDQGLAKFRYRLRSYNDGWIQNSTTNEAIYTSLPPGEFEFEVQASNPDGSWNTHGAKLAITVLPPWWLTWWALIFYSVVVLFLLWVARKYYEKVVVARQANDLALEMSATAEMAMEDVQEQLETQASLLQNLSSRNIAMLAWINELLSRQAETLPDPASAGLALEGTTRIRAFVCLEHALRYHGDRVRADIRAFTDECFAMLSEEFGASSISVINEVDDTPVDGEHAAQLATIIHELLAISLVHAFDDRAAPGNYLRIALSFTRDGPASTTSVVIAIEDNGKNTGDSESTITYGGSALDLVREVAGHYDGSVVCNPHSDTSIRVALSLPPDAVD